MLLDKKTNMSFCRKCCYCEYINSVDYICGINYNDKTNAVIEHRFQFNHSNRSADVALVDEDGNIIYIFEICYKNKTKEENRPEPWFEIDAESFIKNINENEEKETEIVCKRDFKCARCISTEREAKLLVRKQIRIKKEAQLLVQEQINMGEEDVRTIMIAFERSNERIKRELEKKEKDRQETEEYIKEIRRIKNEEREERYEKQRILQKISDQNKICSICKINHCKCDAPNFETDKYKRTACTHCRKQKCKCVRITKFFYKPVAVVHATAPTPPRNRESLVAVILHPSDQCAVQRLHTHPGQTDTTRSGLWTFDQGQ